LTNLFSIKTLRVTFTFICIGLLSACASTSNPSTAGDVSFGEYPQNYKNIIKDFLKKQPSRTPIDLEKIEFLNEPNKFISSQFNQDKFGYRACIIAYGQTARRELRSHFFLINDGKVTQHLHDSGLVQLSNEFCNIEMFALENRLASVAPAEVIDENGFKYITCNTESGNEVFFALNTNKHQLLQQHDGELVASFNITELTDTFIVAESGEHRVSINRVSGTLLHQHNDEEVQASCKLSSKKQF
jgi:hypothetical protein